MPGALLPPQPRWAAYTGQSEEAYQGWGWVDAVHPDDRARAAEVWAECVEAVRPYWEAGFTDVALVQIGDDTMDAFLEQAARPLLEKLRAAAPDD